MQQEIAQPAGKWPAEGNARVPYRMFSDPEIYRAELGRIFLGPTWQYLALAGELPQPGDYLTTFLGETPVIVTRGQDGEIHAMVNRCAHRGNLVCLKRRGHSENMVLHRQACQTRSLSRSRQRSAPDNLVMWRGLSRATDIELGFHAPRSCG